MCAPADGKIVRLPPRPIGFLMTTSPLLDIESLDMEARGVGHLPNEDGTPGKVIFVEGALPGERVRFKSYRRKPKWEAADMTELLRESALRTRPRCQFFGLCGGCAMQHLNPAAQVAIKQRVLEDNLHHIGKVKPDAVMRPIQGPDWGYRYRARLSVRFVEKKGGVLIGFHERKSSYIADMTTCEILPSKVSAMLVPIRALIASLSIKDRLPQVELAIGEDDDGQVIVLVLRIMESLTENDESKLKCFADEWQIEWWLQPKGPDTAVPWYPRKRELQYLLPEFGVRMPFKPTDFTQVNHDLNRVLVRKALGLLKVQAGERIADMFCGLGNFTLPIARLGARVVGVEGSAPLIARAKENAVANGLAERIDYHVANLFEVTPEQLAGWGRFDKMLIDPPREGAVELVKSLGEDAPRRIVYVSCNPATLARDAGLLVHQAGYRCVAAGVVNMFAHTAHVESMAVFERA